MGLLVIHPGLATTVQDLGRPGYRAWGVPLGGAFDHGAAGLANALLGNEPAAAVLELTLVGGTYEARLPLALALAGMPMEAKVRGTDGRERPVTVPSAFPVEPDERLIIGGSSRRGARSYLAVRGGWRTPLILGSRSTETRLKASELLPCEAGMTPVRHVEVPTPISSDQPIRVLGGPDASRFPSEDVYRVGPQSDRMGLRLEGPSWEVPLNPDRISTPVAPGAVQLAGGRPLLLGVACGTMGGYPHVAQVISADLDRVGQLRAGDALTFELVDLDEARRLDNVYRVERRAWLRTIATASADWIERGSNFD